MHYIELGKCLSVYYSVPLLGAILHYLYDFAFDCHEEGGDYTVTNYEVSVVLFNSVTTVMYL